MKKLLATVALIATLASPAYAYDFLFNGVSGTAISATYFVSATSLSLSPQAVTNTASVTGTIAITALGAPCILSNTTTPLWVKMISPGTTCVMSSTTP